MLRHSFLLMAATAASQGVTMSGTTDASHPKGAIAAIVDCGAFKANKDGSWTSVRPTTIGSVTMTEGGTFFPGVQLEGVDVVASLDSACRDHKKVEKGTSE